jgi:FixJ family two-component response regulator
VILLTAFGSPSVTMQAEKAGVFEILRKPFEVHELLAAVRKAAADSPQE